MCAKIDSDEPARGKRSRAAARQRQFVAAALPLFQSRGYPAVTIRDIALVVGVSEGLVYRYFPSKLALYDAACATWVDDLLSSDAEFNDEALDLRKRIDALVETVVQLVERAIVGDSPSDNVMAPFEESRRVVGVTLKNNAALVARWVAREASRGAVAPPSRMGDMATILVQSVAANRFFPDGSNDALLPERASQRAALAELLYRALQAPDGGEPPSQPTG
ncbi:MAG: TetR/AcrR family transcriptional regulator [Dehalococcoidia bacterium]|nr:TetR/AcrR family transcriptional regulator [Dehalococcoidia bacterium]